MRSDLNRSLRARYFVSVLDERTTFASPARAFESTGRMRRLTLFFIGAVVRELGTQECGLGSNHHTRFLVAFVGSPLCCERFFRLVVIKDIRSSLNLNFVTIPKATVSWK